MSASVDFYVPEFGRQLGFDHVISTGVAWNGDRLDGTLTTPNRRGEEKARCLRALVVERARSEKRSRTATATPICRICELAKHGLLVNGSPAARRAAAAMRRRHRGMDLIAPPKACDAHHTYRVVALHRRGSVAGASDASHIAAGAPPLRCGLESFVALRQCQ